MKTKVPTIAGLLTKYLFYIPFAILITVTLISPLISPQWLGAFIMLAILITLVSFMVVDAIVLIPRILLIEQRAHKIAAVLPANSYTLSDRNPSESPVFSALEKGSEGGKTILHASNTEWTFVDYQFNKYTHTKNGKYLSSKIYYSVIQITLPRRLPHIVFDSKHMRGRQMRFSFDKDQQIHLEGNFDTYFDTYFPAHYEIDLLSIITPEVMQTLMTAAKFDIEIYNDHIKLYTSMLPASKVPQAIQLGLSIRDKLLHNITTYSDSRLAVDARKKVHTYGATIQDNFRLSAFKIALGGLVAVLFGVLLVSTDDPAEKVENILHGIVAFLIAAICFGSVVITLKNGYKERRQRRMASGEPTDTK